MDNKSINLVRVRLSEDILSRIDKGLGTLDQIARFLAMLAWNSCPNPKPSDQPESEPESTEVPAEPASKPEEDSMYTSDDLFGEQVNSTQKRKRRITPKGVWVKFCGANSEEYFPTIKKFSLTTGIPYIKLHCPPNEDELKDMESLVKKIASSCEKIGKPIENFSRYVSSGERKTFYVLSDGSISHDSPPLDTRCRKMARSHECGIWLSEKTEWTNFSSGADLLRENEIPYTPFRCTHCKDEKTKILKRAILIAKELRKSGKIVWGYRQYDSMGNLVYVDIITNKVYVNEDFAQKIINS